MATAPTPLRPQPLAGHLWFQPMQRMVERALIDRNRHQSRIADCYKYALPWRHRFGSNQPGDQYDEVFDETVGIVLEDFAADMLNTFTPQKNNWLQEMPVKSFDKIASREITNQIKKRQEVVFSEMARSNLYQALQEAYLDLGPGTMSMLIKDIGPSMPIHCEAMPATELLITRGPYGYIDGQFHRRTYLRTEVQELWPDANLLLLGPAPQNADSQELEITDGCWRDWSNKGDETHRYAVECQGKILYAIEYKGVGSRPFIVAGWARDPTTAWRVGPTYRVLPAIKTLNHVRFLDLKNYDMHVDPAHSYEDDGVANFDSGIVPGRFFPRAAGSEPPQAMESKSRFDVAVFERDELRSIVKRAHYQDEPEQTGKTPPSATQWADEAARRARRMGTPATNLVHELQIPIYRRFVYLLEKRGVLPKVLVEGEELTLEPVSPLLRAQEQEEVVRMDKFAELVGARFGPQMSMVAIDVVPYVKLLAEKLGIPKELVRDEAKIAQAIEQLAPVLQSTGFLPTGTPDVNVPAALPGGG